MGKCKKGEVLGIKIVQVRDDFDFGAPATSETYGFSDKAFLYKREKEGGKQLDAFSKECQTQRQKELFNKFVDRFFYLYPNFEQEPVDDRVRFMIHIRYSNFVDVYTFKGEFFDFDFRLVRILGEILWENNLFEIKVEETKDVPNKGFRKLVSDISKSYVDLKCLFKDNKLEYQIKKQTYYKDKGYLFQELLALAQGTIIRNKQCDDENTISKIVLTINGVEHSYVYDSEVSFLSRFFDNAMHRFVNMYNYQSCILSAFPIDYKKALTIKPNDVDILMYHYDPNMGNGDEIYIATNKKIFYKPLGNYKWHSEEIANAIFPNLLSHIGKDGLHGMGEIFIKDIRYIYVFASAALHSVVLFKAEEYGDLLYSIIDGEGEKCYVNFINYISKHSDVPSRILYRYRNYHDFNFAK